MTLTPWLTAAATAEALDQTDLLLVPSLWPEPFGLVGVEAARRGVPAVAFAVGGIPEWLIDGAHRHPGAGAAAHRGAVRGSDRPDAVGYGRVAADACRGARRPPRGSASMATSGRSSRCSPKWRARRAGQHETAGAVRNPRPGRRSHGGVPHLRHPGAAPARPGASRRPDDGRGSAVGLAPPRSGVSPAGAGAQGREPLRRRGLPQLPRRARSTPSIRCSIRAAAPRPSPRSTAWSRCTTARSPTKPCVRGIRSRPGIACCTAA